MIFRCKCGAMKTGQPWRASGQMEWICEKCSTGKQGREGLARAKAENGGKFHRYSEAKEGLTT